MTDPKVIRERGVALTESLTAALEACAAMVTAAHRAGVLKRFRGEADRFTTAMKRAQKMSDLLVYSLED